MKTIFLSITLWSFFFSPQGVAQSFDELHKNIIVKNGSFEAIECSPTELHQLECAQAWFQATEGGTTDFLDTENRSYFPHVGTISKPPNQSRHFAGLQAYHAGGHFEYLGTCAQLEKGIAYTFEAYIGAAGGRGAFIPGYEGELVIMGLKACQFPLSGKGCKENAGYTELGRIEVSIPAGEWLRHKICMTFTPTQNFQSILIGPSCSTTKRSYILLDDIYIQPDSYCDLLKLNENSIKHAEKLKEQATKPLFLPKKMMVNAENLRFRTAPSTNGKIITEFENGEYLEPLEVVYEDEREANTYDTFKDFWVKVKRLKDGQVGYTFGKYLEAANLAYLPYSDISEHAPKGNWYGLYRDENNAISIEKTTAPKARAEGESYMIDAAEGPFKLYLCMEQELPEGRIPNRGYLLDEDGISLKIGDFQDLGQDGANRFSLYCLGTVEFNPPFLERKNERLVFVTETKEHGQRQYLQQDLTKDILQYGEVGYQILFSGDLNRDGVPDLILREASTKSGTIYFFMSNEKGELELQSRNWSWSKC